MNTQDRREECPNCRKFVYVLQIIDGKVTCLMCNPDGKKKA